MSIPKVSWIRVWRISSTQPLEMSDPQFEDFILFGKSDFKVVQTWKDNTGEKTYTENMAFPTLNFPSDHGILATIIEPSAS